MPKRKKAKTVEAEKLSKEEVADVDEAMKEIEEGKGEKFETADEMIEELHEDVSDDKPEEKSLDDKLYNIYKASPPGPISIGKLLGETGLASQYDSRSGTALLADAWERLRKKRKVKGSQFTKR